MLPDPRRFIQKNNTVLHLDLKGGLLKPDWKADISAKSISSYNNSFEALVSDLQRYKKNGYRVLLLSGSRTRAKRLAADLSEDGLTSFYTEDPDREIKPGEIMTFYGSSRKTILFSTSRQFRKDTVSS